MFCFNVFAFTLVVTIAACLFFLSILMKIICKQSSVFHSENCFFIVDFFLRFLRNKIVFWALGFKRLCQQINMSLLSSLFFPFSFLKVFIVIVGTENFHQRKSSIYSWPRAKLSKFKKSFHCLPSFRICCLDRHRHFITRLFWNSQQENSRKQEN